MVILGVDPGIGRTGWGVIQIDNGKLTMENCGCFETEANSPLVERLLTLHQALDKMIEEYKPEAMAVEELFLIPMLKLHLSSGMPEVLSFWLVDSSVFRLPHIHHCK